MKQNNIIARLVGMDIVREEYVQDIIQKYNESHRYYHNWDHIEALMTGAEKCDILSDELFLSILFHDVIYDPKTKNNELRSADYFKKVCKHPNSKLIRKAIMSTKNHVADSDLDKQLIKLDLQILKSESVDLIDFEHKIFKEFQCYDWLQYKPGRLAALYKLRDTCKAEYTKGISKLIDHVESYRPKIAVYAGSFNPFHIGHLNILQKAEQIFDKVIIARGINPDKKNEIVPLPAALKYHQCESYEGLLTSFIDSLGYDVTLVRGLRNATDLEYEKTQARFLKDLKPDIKIVNILCDAEFEHISSSGIRSLDTFNTPTYKYKVK